MHETSFHHSILYYCFIFFRACVTLQLFYLFITSLLCACSLHTHTPPPPPSKLRENRDHVCFWLLVSGFSEPEQFLMHHGDSVYIWCMHFLCTTFTDKNSKSYKKEVEDLNQQSNIPYSWIRRHGIIKIRIPSPK